MKQKFSLFRITTVPISLKHLINGQMKYMNNNGFNVTMISSSGKELDGVLENEGCPHMILEMTRKITIFKDLLATYKLYKILKKEKPHIVHTHTPKAGIIGMLASYFSNIPIRLHTVAGLPLLEAVGFKRSVLNFVEKLTYRLSTNVFPNSFGLKKIILENKFTTTDKLKVIGNGSSNGIDTSYFNPKLFSFDEKQTLRNNLQIQENDFVFLFVGRIVSDKGINELIEVFNKLSITINNVKLLLVGPYEEDLDPLNENTKQYIDSNKKIISVGYQNDVRSYFAISNVLVFPSYREGFPNVVMQAGAMGIPSIVSDINGCNEIIENHNNGIIVQKKNVEALYNAMNKIYLDKIFYDNMKSNCRALIKNKYECKLIFSLLKDEYENSLIKLLNKNK